MKTYDHLRKYIAELCFQRGIIQTKFVEKIRTHILFSIKFFQNSGRLWDNVEKNGTAGQAIDKNIIRRMRFAS
jgi:hypothetical protein